MKQVLTKLRKNGIDLLSTKPLTSTTTTTSSSSTSPSSSSGGHNSYPSSSRGHNYDREVPEIRIENYHEMSMREARRCDLRNGTAMKSIAAATAIPATTNTATAATTIQAATAIRAPTSTTQTDTLLPSTDTQASAGEHSVNKDNMCVDLRGHRGVIGVLTEVANPPGGELASGNWVRVYYMGIGLCVYVLFRPCERYFC